MATNVLTSAFAWTDLIGTSASEQANSISVAPDGSIYIIGTTFGAFSGQTFSGYEDIFISKINTLGKVLWTKEIGINGKNQGTAVTTSNDGSVYVSGLVGQSNDINDTRNFISKYDANGNLIWSKTINTTGNGFVNLQANSDGSIYGVGLCIGFPGVATAGQYDGILVKYDANGNQLWADSVSLPNKYQISTGATALAISKDGSIYVTGALLYTPGTLNGQNFIGGNTDAFIEKFNQDGSRSWTVVLGSAVGIYTSVYGVTTTTDGSILVSGSTDGNIDGSSNRGAFVANYSNTGVRTWIKFLSIPDTSQIFPNSIIANTDGTFFVSGSLWRQSNINGLSYFGQDGFVAKFTLNGELLWDQFISSSGSDQINSIATLSSSSVIAAGYVGGSINGQSFNGGNSSLLGGDAIVSQINQVNTVYINQANALIQNQIISAPSTSSSIIGGREIDKVIFQSLPKIISNDPISGAAVVTDVNGTYTLNGIERLTFVNSNFDVALDLTGNAGQVVRLIGAIFGANTVHNQNYVGIGLSLLDGGMSYSDLANLALQAAGLSTSANIVNTIYKNVVGVMPSDAILTSYQSMLSSGTSPSALAILAANTDLTAQVIGLPLLVSNGIQYIPQL